MARIRVEGKLKEEGGYPQDELVLRQGGRRERGECHGCKSWLQHKGEGDRVKGCSGLHTPRRGKKRWSTPPERRKW